MISKETESLPLLQGTLDLIILRTLSVMGQRHAYQIAARLERISGNLLNLNQGTLYPASSQLINTGSIDSQLFDAINSASRRRR
jgi:PadR family transcriptional regulator, regulatory protein PadR